jgi:hypothetical protein
VGATGGRLRRPCSLTWTGTRCAHTHHETLQERASHSAAKHVAISIHPQNRDLSKIGFPCRRHWGERGTGNNGGSTSFRRSVAGALPAEAPEATLRRSCLNLKWSQNSCGDRRADRLCPESFVCPKSLDSAQKLLAPVWNRSPGNAVKSLTGSPCWAARAA